MKKYLLYELKVRGTVLNIEAVNESTKKAYQGFENFFKNHWKGCGKNLFERLVR